jgi:hypothetical protein
MLPAKAEVTSSREDAVMAGPQAHAPHILSAVERLQLI